ncbi:MAG TPA: PLP-dependent aminotransferase family protein [Bryobacteraceae bacterium]|nr:PLP-dependent aminotransferase family protein [Bryobacteraceae bacterium]
MRESRGSLLPPVRSERVRRGDVYGVLRNAVLEGILGPGDRLPSTRQAATDYGVSRGLMEEVFGQLTDEGFFVREVGRGTFVAATVSRLHAPPTGKNESRRPAAQSRRGHSAAANAACREPAIVRPFNAGIADTTEFPLRTWQRLQARAMRQLGRDGLTFADPRGLPMLRAAIARYLAQFRGILCAAGQVVVFSSAQQALNALAMLLLDRGDLVWIEDPCYLGARAAFDLAGARLAPVPVDDCGLRVDAGIRRSPGARLAYVTPSHQYPTGAALSLERRVALLEWASERDSWIVEDDYDGEFRYAGQPITPLYSLDSRGRVLYIGTLNKSMFVSLRLAYAVVPEELVEPLANLRTQMDGFTPALTQMAMGLFMDEGYFSSHLRRMRTVYGGKRSALVEGLGPLAACGWTWMENPAGMHLLIGHARGDYVRKVAAASALDLALLSAYRTAPRRDDGLLLRFGALDTASLRAGVDILVRTAERLRARRNSD